MSDLQCIYDKIIEDNTVLDTNIDSQEIRTTMDQAVMELASEMALTITG